MNQITSQGHGQQMTLRISMYAELELIMNVAYQSEPSFKLDENALSRLRAEREKLEVEQREADVAEGLLDGGNWGQNDAEYKDLKALLEADRQTTESLSAADIAEQIGAEAEAVFGAEHADLSTAYLRGWLRGVRYVYDAI